MIPDKIIYTDGHDIIVTDTEFQVKKKSYKLDGIVKHGLLTLQPERVPGIIMLITGLMLLIIGLFELISYNTIPDMRVGDSYVTANTMSVWIGSGLVLIGLIVTAAVRERYAVRISTAEGEKNAVVSRKKEYIAQIVNALNEAYDKFRIHTSTYVTYKKEP